VNHAPDLNPLAVLRGVRFFRDLTEKQLADIATISRMESCREGGQIYGIGDPADYFYVLVSGQIRIVIGLGHRNTSTADVLRAGDVFGWAALMPASDRRIAAAHCLTTCEIVSIDGRQLLRLMERDHTLGYRLMVQLNTLITGTVTAFVAG
jgi:toluene monooxygenase system ferredoxin subunit